MELNVQLTVKQKKALQLESYEALHEGLKTFKRDSKLNSPVLKQVRMAEWLDISVSTLKKWERQGMPSIYIEGIKMYSKQTVIDWVLKHENKECKNEE